MWTGEENLPRLLGGKATTDNVTNDWRPDMDAVRAVIHFTLATKRFEHKRTMTKDKMTVSKDRKTLPYKSSIPHHPYAPSCTRLQEYLPTIDHEHPKNKSMLRIIDELMSSAI